MKPPSLAPLRGFAQINTGARIKTCQAIIGYRFRNQKLIKEALTPFQSLNQRLAIAGDKAADLYLVPGWYSRRLTPLEWNVVTRALLSNENLAKVGFRLRIQDCTLSSCGSGKLMATTVEAIIGAVWLDSKRDLAAVGSVMDRLGLTRHPLMPSPSTNTINRPRCEIRPSRRPLPDQFFIGHHLGLLQLLFNHGQFFMVQQRAGRHGNLSRHEQERDQPTGRLPTGTWLRLKHILFPPQIMAGTTQKRVAVRVGRKDEDHGREPSSYEPTKLPDRHAPEAVLATHEQKSAGRRGSALDDPLWHPTDTERNRIKWFIWGVKGDRDRDPAEQRELVERLQGHLRALQKLPGRSLKNMPDGYSTDGVYLTTHPSNEFEDRSNALQNVLLIRLKRSLYRRIARRRTGRKPEDESNIRLVEIQLVKVRLARLELWLPRDVPGTKAATSPSRSGQTSAIGSPETPGTGSTEPAAADSTGQSTVLSPKDERAFKPGPVLWTTKSVQHTSVDWKNYLGKPTSQNK